MKKTELREAWCWTCDGCGRDQFEHAVQQEIDADKMNEEDFPPNVVEAVELGVKIMIVLMPEQVTCKACGETYQPETTEQAKL